MTRQHFKAIARALSFSQDDMSYHAYRVLCERMASELAAFNPGFKRQTFLDACGADWDGTPATDAAAVQVLAAEKAVKAANTDDEMTRALNKLSHARRTLRR